MTDKEFENLQIEIENHMVELSKLQTEHIKQTGRQFILGQPIVHKDSHLWGLEEQRKPENPWTKINPSTI